MRRKTGITTKGFVFTRYKILLMNANESEKSKENIVAYILTN